MTDRNLPPPVRGRLDPKKISCEVQKVLDCVTHLVYMSRQPGSEGRLPRGDPEGGARRGVLRRRLATAPREARDPARQALGPGREELALRIRRQCRSPEARPPAKNRHGGAPRGARPPLGTRGASQAPGVPRHEHAGVPRWTPRVSRRSATPRRVAKGKVQSPGAMRRGNEKVCEWRMAPFAGLFDIVKMRVRRSRVERPCARRAQRSLRRLHKLVYARAFAHPTELRQLARAGNRLVHRGVTAGFAGACSTHCCGSVTVFGWSSPAGTTCTMPYCRRFNSASSCGRASTVEVWMSCRSSTPRPLRSSRLSARASTWPGPIRRQSSAGKSALHTMIPLSDR